MSARAAAAPGTGTRVRDPFANALLFAAPLAAVAAGCAAEWLDFRALRYPLLAMMLAGVVATASALDRRGDTNLAPRGVAGTMLRAVLAGVLAWTLAESVYVMLHVLRGEAFDAQRFGPQPAQALGLIAVHALFLGGPTGLAAAALVWLRDRFSRPAR